MMELTEEQIEKLKEYAKLMFSYEDLAYMIGIKGENVPAFVELASNAYSSIGEVIKVCRLETIALLRQRIIDSAVSGSSSAQDSLKKMINDLNFENE